MMLRWAIYKMRLQNDFTSVCTYGAITHLYTTLEFVPTLTVSQRVFQLAACIVLRPPLPGEPWEG